MKTIKVQVAVAVDEKGVYNTCGWTDLSEEEALRMALEGLPVDVGLRKTKCYMLIGEAVVPEPVDELDVIFAEIIEAQNQ